MALSVTHEFDHIKQQIKTPEDARNLLSEHIVKVGTEIRKIMSEIDGLKKNKIVFLFTPHCDSYEKKLEDLRILEKHLEEVLIFANSYNSVGLDSQN